MFPALIDDERVSDLQILRSKLLARTYPTDFLLHRELRYRNLYARTNLRLVVIRLLTEVNRILSIGTDVNVALAGEPTIEHVMPRSLNSIWQNELGPEHERIHRELLNTLGNLTLVTKGKNSELSNSSWSKKRKLLQEHGLPLNQKYDWPERWDENAILQRTEWLVGHLCKHWPDLADKSENRVTALHDDNNRHPRLGFDYTGTKIHQLVIGERSWNKNWNELPIILSEQVAVPHPDFEETAEQLTGWYGREKKRKYDHQLSNGWWVRNGQSANVTAEFCIDLAALCEIPANYWQIIFKEKDS